MTREEAIHFCRENTMRSKTVLGKAQLYYPKAYQEYIDNANKNLGFNHHFTTLGYPDQGRCDSRYYLLLFSQREEEIKSEEINNAMAQFRKNKYFCHSNKIQ